ncbi:MAG TPA: ROK family protein [Burkholderiaceae bacterium]|nr:ROK family protein [Burkholderiaceae bacterium]
MIRTGLRAGIDVGGTKIEIAALDSDGAFRLRHRVPTPRDDYAATLTAIAALVRDGERRLGRFDSVGIGIPGSLSPRTGTVRNANSTWLNGQPLLADLQQALQRPVRIDNDANCLAVSEAVDGAAAGQRLVIGVILGTGVGAGIAIDGASWSGRNRIAGEWGHNPLPAPRASEFAAPRCWCARDGCIETWLCGPALLADHRRSGAAADSVPQLLAAAQAGEPAAAATLDRWVERLARSLATLINMLDPDAIVVGGGLSHIETLYERVPQLWQSHVFCNEAIDTPLLRSRHGDSSGVRGAAWLWPRDRR